jgi:membrane protein YqaA with SNARE-associated domain
MARFLNWVQAMAFALGGPGVFLIAVLDSSFLSFPEVVDLLIVVLVTHHKERMIYYAGLATLGSIVGCFLARSRCSRSTGCSPWLCPRSFLHRCRSNPSC